MTKVFPTPCRVPKAGQKTTFLEEFCDEYYAIIYTLKTIILKQKIPLKSYRLKMADFRFASVILISAKIWKNKTKQNTMGIFPVGFYF